METATQTLHRLTSFERFEEGHEWDPPVADPRVVRDYEPNDLSRLPWFYKRYAQPLPRVELPPDLPATTAAAVDVLAGTADVPRAELSVAHLARLLHLSAGVVRTSDRSYGQHLFRAAGSAGGRFPLEVYVAVPDGSQLPPGVHWYHPQDHALVQIGPPPDGDAPAVVVTGVPWRTGWRYRERGFRHVYWDAGTMVSQLLAAADSAGITARLHSRFPDGAVADLVGADTVHEWPVAIVVLGDGTPAIAATGSAAAGPVDAAPLEFPLVTAAQRAGDGTALGPAWDRGDPVPAGSEGARPLESVVLARGSQRLMDPHGRLPVTLLRTSMSAALRGVSIPHWVAVHGVDGLEPGLHRWPDLTNAVRAGDLRDDLYHVCFDQGLGRDAAFVVIAAAEVSTLDDRQYREAQLAAGLVEGRLHLLAYAQDASASGMTFIDSLVPRLLGEPVEGLLLTCVGVPEYRSAAGGTPGAPVAVRPVTPRL